MSRKEALSSFIQQIHARPVVVKLNSGVDYRGVLACLDGYMNIALEQTEEYVNGQLKNKFGDVFIRAGVCIVNISCLGNNVLWLLGEKIPMERFGRIFRSEEGILSSIISLITGNRLKFNK